jgi:hypothetical protein
MIREDEGRTASLSVWILYGNEFLHYSLVCAVTQRSNTLEITQTAA